MPGKLKKMGFGYEKLQNINPMLIYCSITGFGQKGQDSKKPGYDLIANAQGGMLHITGEKVKYALCLYNSYHTLQTFRLNFKENLSLQYLFRKCDTWVIFHYITNF